MRFKQEHKDTLISYLREENQLKEKHYTSTFFWRDSEITLNMNRRSLITGEFMIDSSFTGFVIEGFQHTEFLSSQEDDVIQMGLDILIKDIEKDRVTLRM